MNELLVLLKTAADVSWLYLCIVGAIAMGLLAYDRRRNRHAPDLTVVPVPRSDAGDVVNESDDVVAKSA